MKLYFVTKNQGKFEEVARVLSPEITLIKKEIEILEPQIFDVFKISQFKAEQAFKVLKHPLIVDDTGVYFSCYKNFPGALARLIYEGLGIEGLMRLLKSCEDKSGYFLTVITYYDGKRIKQFSSKLEGEFKNFKFGHLKEIHLPYNLLFIPKGRRKCLAEIKQEEKDFYNQRIDCAMKLKKWLLEI